MIIRGKLTRFTGIAGFGYTISVQTGKIWKQTYDCHANGDFDTTQLNGFKIGDDVAVEVRAYEFEGQTMYDFVGIQKV